MFSSRKKRFRFYKRMKLKDDRIVLKLRAVSRAGEEPDPVNAYLFDICALADGAALGRCDLRVGYTEKLYYAGHIGYTVFEPYRGNRYALSACFLLQRLAKRHGMTELIITCNPENHASKRTCELFGASYVRTVALPEDHELFLQGERRKHIFIKSI